MSNEQNTRDKKNQTHLHDGHSSHHHHHKSRGHLHHPSGDISSSMERKGKNIIYTNVRKEKLFFAFKRAMFCIIFIALVAFLFISAFKSPESETDFKLFDNNAAEEEIIELKNKIINYEYYIEELEERLSVYEDVESIFEKENN